MCGKIPSLLMSFILLLFFVWTPFALAQVHLQYQSRGNRYEGVKPKPVSGYDIELLSALTNYQEAVSQKPPDQFKVKLYLERSFEVYLTVRELDPKRYYWMDKVQPSQPWKPGFGNIFAWPTQVVIQQLAGIEMYDLGVVARLEKPEPSKVDRVAPVIFYHSQLPATITGYLFTFKTAANAQLTWSVFKEGEAEPVFPWTPRQEQGGRPFVVRWDAAKASEGYYKLMMSGYFRDNNNRFDYSIRFYHQPNVK
jgi:hypothetical protein